MRGEVFYSFLILVTNRHVFVDTQTLNKCCEKEMVLKNGAYFCKNESKTAVMRLNINFEISDNHTKCIDISDKTVSVFTKENVYFTKTESIDVITKCCPLQYFYNTTQRSCVKLENKNNSFNKDIVKIGLPQCEIISDLLVDFKTDVTYNSSLAVAKTGEVFLENQFCLDETVDGKGVVRICRSRRFCKKVKCLRKCCADGQSFINGSHCEDTFVYGMQLDRFKSFIGEIKNNFAIKHGYPGTVYVQPNTSMFYLDEKGNFHNRKTETMFPINKQPYCLEHATKGSRMLGEVYFGFFISESPPLPKKFHWNRAAMVVSAVFLFFTIVFYVISRETKKVFGKILVCFCCCLLLLYILLVFHTFTTNLHFKSTKKVCKILGFIIIYLGFCSFIWLQIMCYDIHCTFGASSKYLVKSEKKKRDLLKFLSYNLYGWGLPLVYTIVLAVFHVTDALPETIKIEIGVTRCAIEKGHYAEILFRAIPLTVIQIFNFVFFIKTVIYVLEVKKEINKMVETPSTLKKKRKFFKKRERFGLVLKLSITMGVFYLFEVISSFFDFNDYEATATLEIIWDFINCLQGLFIFLIFVCKRRNYDRFKKSNAIERIRKISLSASRKTSVTTFANVNNGS